MTPPSRLDVAAAARDAYEQFVAHHTAPTPWDALPLEAQHQWRGVALRSFLDAHEDAWRCSA